MINIRELFGFYAELEVVVPLVSEDSFFFMKIESVCRRPVITCSPETTLVEMSRVMKRDNISGIVALDGEKPAGIVSLRDLRNLVADGADDLKRMTVRDLMKRDIITIKKSDYLFKAVFLMARHNIHRLVVTDEDDRLFGIMTDTDILRIQTKSPVYLVQEIESAETMEQLQAIAGKMTGMLKHAVSTHADPQSLVQLVAHFNDAISLRIISILDRVHDIRLPEGAAFLALGSEGREEQTLRTDQDNAIVYMDDFSDEEISQAMRFGARMVAELERIGVPLCPGDIMASNPEWVHSLSDWKLLVKRWIAMPGPDETVYFGVFQDLRVLYGEKSFERALREHICECARTNSHFFPNMARNIVRFKPPVGMFGRFIVEKKGAKRGKLDIKKGGLFALTRGIGLLALEAGIAGGSTWDKIERLEKLNLVSPHDLEAIKESFTVLMKMRLEKQLAAISAGLEPGNHIDPLLLAERERDRLRMAFKGVATLLGVIQRHYQLNLVSH